MIDEKIIQEQFKANEINSLLAGSETLDISKEEKRRKQQKVYCTFYPLQFDHKPTEEDMKITTTWLWKNVYRQKGLSDTVENFFEASQGRCLCPAELKATRDADGKSHLEFVRSNLILIDIDDVACEQDPKYVLSMVPFSCGLIYTWSYVPGKCNKYRLVVKVDQCIEDEEFYTKVAQEMKSTIRDLGLFKGENVIDKNASCPHVPSRLGNKGYVISSSNIVAHISDWLEKVNRREDRETESIRRSFLMSSSTSYDELYEMAVTIGEIPMGGTYGEFTRLCLSVKSAVENGTITDDEGYSIYEVLSGSHAKRSQWNSYNPHSITIGTFIRTAQEAGYKQEPKHQYDSVFNTEPEPITAIEKETTLKCSPYFPTEWAESMLANGERILVDSPTGSGKTQAFVTALKEIAKDEFGELSPLCVISYPTRALVEQSANKYGLFAVYGEDKSGKLMQQAEEAADKRPTVFACTYDKLPALINKSGTIVKHYVVIDEWHKLVTDYEKMYRKNTIHALIRAVMGLPNLVGLTGTAQDVDHNYFNRVIHVHNGREGSPNKEYQVYRYNTAKYATDSLVDYIIDRTQKGLRLLVFVQNKSLIMQIDKRLSLSEVSAEVVTSDNKEGSVYQSIINRETVPENAQVILTTSVIMDGVNINNKENWECVCLSNNESPLFNLSLMKQASNRFRNPYERFTLFIQADDRKGKVFPINRAFAYRLKVAESLINAIDRADVYNPWHHDQFRAGTIEEEFGVEPDGLQIFSKLQVDRVQVRHLAALDKENYYKTFRSVFAEELGKLLGNVPKAINGKQIEDDKLKVLKEAKEKEDAGKQARIAEVFTEELYNAFIADGSKEKISYKKTLLSRHYNAIESMAEYGIPYNIARKILPRVEKNNQEYTFVQQLDALRELSSEPNEEGGDLGTRATLAQIKKDCGNYQPSKQIKKYIDAMDKQLGRSSVKRLVKRYFVEDSRHTKHGTEKRLSFLTMKYVAEMWGIDRDLMPDLVRENDKI